MNRNRIIAFVICMIFFGVPFQGSSQQTKNNEGFKLTPVSPNTASLGMYGHTPVGHYTGVPNIDIPFYEIDLDGKKIPISLSYHASGIRVSQEASSVGLGWTLNVGGCITKTINGEDDFRSSNLAFKSYYTDTVSIANMQNLVRKSEKLKGNVMGAYSEYISSGGKGEPDLYYYNFGGFSGKMVFDRIGTVYKGHINTATAAKAVLLNPKAYIDVLYNPTDGTWTVKDMDGYTYGFESGESSSSFSLHQLGLLDKTEQELKTLSFSPAETQTTAYYLTYIESPLKNRVTFNYEVESICTPISLQEQMYSSTSPHLLQFYRYDKLPPTDVQLLRKYNDVTYSYNRIKQLRPTSITFNGGSIQINAINRTDLQIIPNETAPKKISSVEIKDTSGKLIKSYSFTQSYRGSIPVGGLNYLSTRLMLDKVTENNGAVHSFTYNAGELPAKNSFETDFWGFYNMGEIEGYPKTFETVPSTGLLGEMFYGRNKRPKPELLQNMMLTQIQYPTGGTSDFYFEPHDIHQTLSYLFDKVQYAGGISTTVQGPDYNDPCNLYGTTGKIVTQDFELDNAVETAKLNFRVSNISGTTKSCGSATNSFNVSLEVFDGTNYVAWREPGYSFSVSHTQLNYEKNNSTAFTYLSKGKYRLKVQVGTPSYVNFSVFAGLEYIGRSEVNEEIIAGAGLRIQKIIDKVGNKSETRHFSYSGTIPMYNPVFSTPEIVAPNYYNVSSLPGYPSFDPNNTVPLHAEYLISSTSSIVPFSNAAQGNLVGYTKVTEHFGENSENGYTEYLFRNQSNSRLGAGADQHIPFFPTKEDYLNGSPRSVTVYNKDALIVQKDTFNYKINSVKNIAAYKIFLPKPLDALDGAYFGYYDVKAEENVLENKSTTAYVNGLIAQDIKENYIYDLSYSLLISKETINSQGKSRQELIKYPFDYTDVISTGMLSKNLKGIPIERLSIVDNKVVHGYKTVYKDTLSMYLPSKSYSFESTVPQALTTYSNYYKNDYTFTKYNDKGKLLEFLSPDKTMTTYLWNTSGVYPIAIIKNANYSQVMTAFSGYDFSGTGTLNSSKELLVRANLPNSLISTYIYQPLVGMKSKTDTRGITESYQYDGMQRLQAILDHLNDVTKSFDYHYKSN
ncbi:hypothetical protein LZQ00_08245 [Sphingobacterium sp. SRCM116780]|uniref:hypothetical protein n=1 Tax=Sphingobacterium sp. SRCM116780 TaxID=2907623 RepID=UPI001F3A6715|nr:hypothetical protein [Sphingobacterium sp. SRCM116780]UIR57797.1 hypothetical protein LZQ00_08245 [Sphingobacterium sp. SRCM116780]